MILAAVDLILKENVTTTVGVITFVAGLYFGNKLAIGRDRRKEFNDIASPLFEKLEKQRWALISKKPYYLESNFDPIPITRMISCRKQNAFKKAVIKYKEAKLSCGSFDDSGRYVLDRPEILLAAIEALQHYLPLK